MSTQIFLGFNFFLEKKAFHRTHFVFSDTRSFKSGKLKSKKKEKEKRAEREKEREKRDGARARERRRRRRGRRREKREEERRREKERTMTESNAASNLLADLSAMLAGPTSADGTLRRGKPGSSNDPVIAMKPDLATSPSGTDR